MPGGGAFHDGRLGGTRPMLSGDVDPAGDWPASRIFFQISAGWHNFSADIRISNTSSAIKHCYNTSEKVLIFQNNTKTNSFIWGPTDTVHGCIPLHSVFVTQYLAST